MEHVVFEITQGLLKNNDTKIHELCRTSEKKEEENRFNSICFHWQHTEHVVDESQIRRKMVGIMHVSNSERGASAQNIWLLR